MKESATVVATTTFALVSALLGEDCVVSIQGRGRIEPTRAGRSGSKLIYSGVEQAKPVDISNCSEEAHWRAAILNECGGWWCLWQRRWVRKCLKSLPPTCTTAKR